MYIKYFGFKEKPFTLTPNPRFIFLSKNHKEAFAHLLYGINNHYGFIELIGEVGTGKTTILRTLLGQLQDENYRSALIFNPCLTGVELLRSINHEFGIADTGEYANDLLAELNRFLLDENSKGRTVVLVIDEAQNLEPDVLEQVRLISNLETENDKLIQIILAGQPELEPLLKKPELRQLNQRIAVRYRLRSMSMAETRAYIKHRMEVAGETGGVSFSPFAIRLIYLYTRGVPRMINILCDRSLLIGYGDEKRRISSGIVSRAIREILNLPRSQQRSWAFAAITILAIIGFTAFFYLNQNQVTPTASATTQKTLPSTPAAVQPTVKAAPIPPPPQQQQPLSRIEQELMAYDQNDFHIKAFNALATPWGADPIQSIDGRLTVPDMFSRFVAKRNLQITPFKGSLNDVIRFGIPFLMVTKTTGSLGGGYCIAVTGSTSDKLTVSPPISGSSSVNKNEITSVANGTYYLIWKNYGQIPETIKLDEKKFEITNLQKLLKQAKFYNEPIDGHYSNATIKAVRDFQNANGIPGNDKVGSLTLAALAKFDTKHKAPSLTGK